MRVIGGTRKGRRLASFRCPSIRPTSDKVREAVFNVLERGNAFKKALDLFAGTGAMGIEALSRGSVEAVFVERDARAVSVIRKNLKTCGFEDKARVLKREVLGSIRYLSRRGERFDLVFIDAPYGQDKLTVDTLRALAGKGLLEHDATVVCEASKRGPAIDPTGIEGIAMIQKKNYGDTVVYFFRAG
jgi:16S rRNA (guanine(966)-N(2))-methyltransferase RsmD